MTKLAKEAGANIVKFQYYDPVDVLGKDHPALDYVLSCRLKQKDHEKLALYCQDLGVEYLVSAFDVKDIPWAASLCKRMKIASRMNQNLEFIAHVERTKLPVIMSIQPDTTIRKCHRDRFYFMWCVRNYPSTMEEVLKGNFSYKYGLSSHCPDYRASVEAYKQGARIFENHVKEFDTDQGCDMSSSITLTDYKRMTDEITGLDNLASREGTLSTGV